MSRSNEDFSVGVHGGNTSSELYLLAYKPDPHGINTTNYCTHDASHTRRTQAHPTIRCSSSARGARLTSGDRRSGGWAVLKPIFSSATAASSALLCVLYGVVAPNKIGGYTNKKTTVS